MLLFVGRKSKKGFFTYSGKREVFCTFVFVLYFCCFFLFFLLLFLDIKFAKLLIQSGEKIPHTSTIHVTLLVAKLKYYIVRLNGSWFVNRAEVLNFHDWILCYREPFYNNVKNKRKYLSIFISLKFKSLWSLSYVNMLMFIIYEYF